MPDRRGKDLFDIVGDLLSMAAIIDGAILNTLAALPKKRSSFQAMEHLQAAARANKHNRVLTKQLLKLLNEAGIEYDAEQIIEDFFGEE